MRVLGINNSFLAAAIGGAGERTEQQWRELHEASCEAAGQHYLFHRERRNCWALLVAVGESGDVTFIPYTSAISALTDVVEGVRSADRPDS